MKNTVRWTYLSAFGLTKIENRKLLENNYVSKEEISQIKKLIKQIARVNPAKSQ